MLYVMIMVLILVLIQRPEAFKTFKTGIPADTYKCAASGGASDAESLMPVFPPLLATCYKLVPVLE